MSVPSVPPQPYGVLEPTTWSPKILLLQDEKGIQDGDEEHKLWSQTDWIPIPDLTLNGYKSLSVFLLSMREIVFPVNE